MITECAFLPLTVFLWQYLGVYKRRTYNIDLQNKIP